MVITYSITRGGSKTDATSKMEHFVIIVNGWKPLDVAAVLEPPLITALRSIPRKLL